MLGVLGYMPNISSLRAGKLVLIDCALIAFLALFFISNKYLSSYLIWCVLGVFLFYYMGFMHGADKVRENWIMSMCSMTKQFAFFVVCYEVIKQRIDDDFIEKFFNILVIMGILQSLLVISQACGVWPMLNPKGAVVLKAYFDKTIYRVMIVEPLKYIPTGFLSNPNMSGSLLALCLPAFLRGKLVFLTPLLGVSVFLSQSLGGIIPFTVVMLIYFYRINKVIFYSLLFILGLAVQSYAFLFDNLEALTTGSGRFSIWKVFITKYIPIQPILGVGFGRAGTLYAQVMKDTATKVAFLHPHNEFIGVAMETGVIGLGLIVGYFVSIWRKGMKLAKDNMYFLILLGVLVGLINCNVNFLLHTSSGIVFAIYLCIIDGGCNGVSRRV